MNNERIQLDLFDPVIVTGETLRDKGIEKAIDYANKTYTCWSEQAFDFLLRYIQTVKEFMTEDMRKASVGIVPTPPSLRAWGGVIMRATKAGLIKKTGFKSVVNKKAHCANAGVWTKN